MGSVFNSNHSDSLLMFLEEPEVNPAFSTFFLVVAYCNYVTMGYWRMDQDAGCLCEGIIVIRSTA